jgi:hypothetical protein
MALLLGFTPPLRSSSHDEIQKLSYMINARDNVARFQSYSWARCDTFKSFNTIIKRTGERSAECLGTECILLP